MTASSLSSMRVSLSWGGSQTGSPWRSFSTIGGLSRDIAGSTGACRRPRLCWHAPETVLALEAEQRIAAGSPDLRQYWLTGNTPSCLFVTDGADLDQVHS